MDFLFEDWCWVSIDHFQTYFGVSRCLALEILYGIADMRCDLHHTKAPVEDDRDTQFCGVPGTSQTRVFVCATSATGDRACTVET